MKNKPFWPEWGLAWWRAIFFPWIFPFEQEAVETPEFRLHSGGDGVRDKTVPEDDLVQTGVQLPPPPPKTLTEEVELSEEMKKFLKRIEEESPLCKLKC